jgi:hypothetical protein
VVDTAAAVAVHRLWGDACVVAGGGVAAAGGHGWGDRGGVGGEGHWVGWRRIAALLGQPGLAVRGWLRRFAGRLEAVRALFTWWLRALEPDPVMPEPAGSGWADALAAVTAATWAVAKRFVLPRVSPWEVAVAISNGRLLAPGWPLEWINTS